MTERADFQSQDPSTSIEHYLAPLRDHRRVILLVAAVTLGLGALIAVVGPRSYTARTSVLIYPVAADPTEALQGAERSDDMATELRIADSRAVADMAAAQLDELGIDVTPREASAAISVANPDDSRVLTISYQAADPAVARVGSELATASYLTYRSELNAASRQIARTSINDEIAILQDRLAATEEQIDQAAAGSAALRVAEVELASIEGELQAQQRALADLSTLSIDAANVFDTAREPGSADGIGTAQLLVGALAGGLVLGIIAAWTLAALGVGPDALRPTLPGGRSDRAGQDDDDDGEDDADSPFDDSDNRDPLELLKALEAIEDDPEITLDPPSTAADPAAVAVPAATVPPAAAPSSETWAEVEVPAEVEADHVEQAEEASGHEAEAEGMLQPSPAAFDADPVGLPTLTQPTVAETPAAETVDPFDPTPYQLDTETGFAAELDPHEAHQLPTEPEFGASSEDTVPAEDEHVATVDPFEPDQEPVAVPETGFDDGTETPWPTDSVFEVDEAAEVDESGFGLTGAEEPAELVPDEQDEHELVQDEHDEDALVQDAQDEDELVEASQTSGDPNDLDPGPPSWDGPFVGPTTWEQLSAMAAASEPFADEDDETDLDEDAELDVNAEFPTEAGLTAEMGLETDTDTDTADVEPAHDDVDAASLETASLDAAAPDAGAPSPISPSPAAAELVATNDVDALFEQLGQLGSTGPVAVLSLSDRHLAAGLTAGFELADELRAVGANVLLIDARIENPVLDTLFDDATHAGLAQVVTGEVILGAAVRNLDGLDGLDLLTTGRTDAETADHLVGAAFQRLMAEARLNYHSIVVIAGEVVADEEAQPADLERVGALAAAVDALIVGTADPIGTVASDELVAVLDTLATPTLQLVTAPVPTASDAVHEASGV